MHAECTERATRTKKKPNTNQTGNNAPIELTRRMDSKIANRFESQLIEFLICSLSRTFFRLMLHTEKTVHIFGPKTENTQHTYTDAHNHNIYVSGVHSFNVVIKFIYSLGRFHSNLKQVHACIPHDLCIDS